MDTPTTTNFGSIHFGGAALGDRRRSKRLIALADRIMQHPGGTWPDKLPDPADLDAFYRLVNRPESTHAAILAPHRAETLRRMHAATETVLILHDTTELDYSGLESMDLAPIGGGHNRQDLLYLAKLELQSQQPSGVPNHSASQSERLLGQSLPLNWQMPGNLLFPPAFLGACDFGELGQTLGNFGIELLFQQRHELPPHAITRVVEIAVTGIFMPSLGKACQVALNLFTADV